MEEVKQYHRNLAVTFYDYKKVYDKVHHDWMLRVYKRIGIPDEVIKLISNLMELWKTRLEIWNKAEKMTSRWINKSCGFLQVIHQLGFASPRYQYVNYCSRAGGTEWVQQETEMSVEHTAYLLMIWRCIKKAMRCQWSYCTSKSQYWSMLWYIEMCRDRIRSWKDAQRRRIRSSRSKNECNGPRGKWDIQILRDRTGWWD